MTYDYGIDSRMARMFDTLAAIWHEDSAHIIRFLAIMNEGMLFRRCIQFRCGLEREEIEECKECPIHDISDIVPYLKRLYLGDEKWGKLKTKTFFGSHSKFLSKT